AGACSVTWVMEEDYTEVWGTRPICRPHRARTRGSPGAGIVRQQAAGLEEGLDVRGDLGLALRVRVLPVDLVQRRDPGDPFEQVGQERHVRSLGDLLVDRLIGRELAVVRAVE